MWMDAERVEGGADVATATGRRSADELAKVEAGKPRTKPPKPRRKVRESVELDPFAGALIDV